MAYDKKKIFEQSKDAIVKNNLFFVEDILGFVAISKTTLYEFFPVESDEMNELKGLLEVNKLKTKASIRAKLYKSPKAAELLALYRLICTNEERQMLNQQYIDHTTKGQSFNKYDDWTDEQIKAELERLDGKTK
jgi:hypothetical protein